VILSGFWSVVNERFDPRAGKTHFTRIVSAANIGGVVGGLLAERVAAMLTIDSLLPVLGVLHLLCAWLVSLVARRGARRVTTTEAEQGEGNAVQVLFRRPYLRHLALLVVLLAVSSGIVDYVFKAEAVEQFEGEQLMRFFAWFYMGISILTVVLQRILARPALAAFGLGRTVAVLPAVVAIGGVGTLLAPGLWSSVALRSADGGLRNSVFASAYELLYVPLPRGEKRRTKALIDIGAGRAGDALGGVVVSVLLLLGALAQPAMLGVVVVLSGCGVLVTFLLGRGYVAALERSLMSQAEDLDLLEDIEDGRTRSVLFRTMGSMELKAADPRLSQVLMSTILAPPPGVERPSPAAPPAAAGLPSDPLVRRIVQLRSRDPDTLRQALRGPVSSEVVPHVIPLLAWNEMARTALDALVRSLPQCTGQLVDALVDEDQEFSIRRRIPWALGRAGDERAASGLLGALKDPRFEVRYRCARALAQLKRRVPDLTMDSDRIEAVVLRETKTERSVWASRRLLDEAEDTESELVDAFLRDRANRSLEHVFTLLSLVLPPDPLSVAFRGLHTDEPQLRGTALEYLENVLPDEIRKRLWPLLGDEPKRKKRAQSSEAALDDLLKSHASIQLNLEEIRKRQALLEKEKK
jgi:HEAT repeat protein